MGQVAANGTLLRWQRLVLVVGVLVVVWGPAHCVEIVALVHGVEGVAGSHGAAVPVGHGPERVGVSREPGGSDDHRCGRRDAEHDGTQATSARLPQPGRVLALRLTESSGPVPLLEMVAAPATSAHVLECARAFAARVNRAARLISGAP